MIYWLNMDTWVKPIQQKKRQCSLERTRAISDEVNKLLGVKMIREVQYPTWFANLVIIRKQDGSW